jgi:hypothetical protein
MASYGGDSTYRGSVGTTTHTTVRVDTATSVATSPDPSVFAHPVTATASVTPSGVTGSVSFYANGQPIAGCTAQAVSPGTNGATATCTTSTLPVGGTSIIATYSGDNRYNGSSGSTTQLVLDDFKVDIQQIRDDLNAYRQQNPSPKSTYDHITNAIAHLDKALAPTLWQPDDRHLTSTGATVFNEDKAAMDELLKIGSPRPQVVSNAIPSIVSIDRAIAQLQYDDANTLINSITPTNMTEYQKAKSELAAAYSELQKGIQDQSSGNWDNSVGHFKNAWQHAVYAVQHANQT